MKADFKPVVLFESGYFNLSEKLRSELELKIDRVYEQNRFSHYINNQLPLFENTSKSDLLCTFILNKAPKDYVLSGKLLQGIKTWFNMCHGDRLSVINKFSACYPNIMPLEKVNKKPVITIIFCKFLISELLSILAESRWQNVANHAN